MARFTIELNNLLKISDFNLFDFDYTIDDASWKIELEQAIIDFYKFYEIGQETPDRFKHVFKSKLKLIMPYYNQLYHSQLLVVDPLLTTYLRETMNDNKAINSTSNAASNTTFTEFPEHTSIVDDIASNKSQSLSDNTQGTNATHDYEKVIQGYQGQNVSQLITAYRKNIINVNQMIIEELKPCFMLNFTV